MNCFYRIFYRTALLVFLLCSLGLQNSKACEPQKPEISGSDTVCENSFVLYNINYYEIKDYKWTVTNGEIKSWDLKGYHVLWNKPGIGTITLNAKDRYGCAFSATKTVVIQHSNAKKFEAGPDVYVCSGDTAYFSVDSLPGYRYEWGDLRYYFGENESERPFYKFLVRGFAKVTVSYDILVSQIEVSTGCRYYDTVKIIINPRYKTNITGATGCLNDSTVYSYSTDIMPHNARWETEGGEILSDNKSKSVQVKWNRIGKNKLILKYFTGDCKDSTFIETGLSAVKPPFYAGPDVVACHGDTVTLGMPPIPNCTYQWLDIRYILFEQWDFESYIKRPFYSPTNKTDVLIIYKVILTDTISECRFYDTVKLTVKPRIKANITGTVGCYNEIASFTTDTLLADAYWIAEGGEIISDNKGRSILVRWNRNGTNIIKLKYNHNGCTDSAMYIAETDSLTHFPVVGADSIFENTFHTYTVENLGNTINKWSVTGGEIISETENAITVQWGNINPYAQIQSYKVNEKGCSSYKFILPVVIKKREKLDLSHTFQVYPNPFSVNIYIAPVNDYSGNIRMVLSDITGRKILEQTAYINMAKNALNWNISAAGLQTGMYFLSIYTADGLSTWKIVRE